MKFGTIAAITGVFLSAVAASSWAGQLDGKTNLSDGSLSAYIAALGLGKMLKYEYVPEFQSALYAPAPLKAMLERD